MDLQELAEVRSISEPDCDLDMLVENPSSGLGLEEARRRATLLNSGRPRLGSETPPVELGGRDLNPSKRDVVTAAASASPENSIYAEESQDQLKMAKALLESTPSVRVVVEVPKHAHDLLAKFYGGQLSSFYSLAVASAVRHWADLEYDTTSHERLEVYRALDRLATARSILAWVSFDQEQEGSLQELEELQGAGGEKEKREKRTR